MAVLIRGLEIGCGQPKIFISAQGGNLAEVLRDAALAKKAGADVVEWRADLFERVGDDVLRLAALRELRALLGETPLLFTLRSAAQGGAFEGGLEECARILSSAATTGQVDLLDIEPSSGDKICRELAAFARGRGVKVMFSIHELFHAPAPTRILKELANLRALGADIGKYAATANTPGELLALMEAQLQASSEIDLPLAVMPMGRYGAAMRLCCGEFGAAFVFGRAGRASAPGQPYVGDIRAAFEAILRARDEVPSNLP